MTHMLNQLRPRDFRAPGTVLQADFATMLQHDPKAFDCLIFPALPGRDETVAVEADPVGALDSNERAQTYGQPEPGRALIVPEEGLDFDVLAGELANSFLGASAPMNILLSKPVRNFSLIQWLEYATPDAEEPELRTVYVLDSKAAGRTAGAGVVYICAPLPALGEVPDLPPAPEEPEPDGEGEPDAGAHVQIPAADDPVGVL